MCLTLPLHDPASGLNLTKGCQILDGDQALAYVRDRHDFAEQDLQREQDQRHLPQGPAREDDQPGRPAQPVRADPGGRPGRRARSRWTAGTSLLPARPAWRSRCATRRPPRCPIASSNYVDLGRDAVLWDRSQALELFNDLNAGTTVPGSLITGSSQAS